MSSNVTRRSFFKGAGLAALGGLSAAALSGCGHGYAAAEPTNPSAGDFGGPSWLGAPPVIDEADIAETIETEVLVVGMGTGGIPAMISAAENGAKVLGIDRQGTPHNVREDIGAIDSRLQQASFDEFPEFRIEKKEAVEDIVRYANGFVNYDLVKLWADESGAMVDWLTDIIQRDGKLVMEFEGGVGDTSDPGRDKAFATGHSPQKTDAVAEDEEWGFAESILAYAAEQGAEVRWYTEFIKCETDESGRVTGVIARDVQGDRPYLRINASRGVILSTGGYGNNLEMMEDRQAWNQKIRIACPGSGGNPTGDGIKAGLWAGASKDKDAAPMVFDRGAVAPGVDAGYEGEGEGAMFRGSIFQENIGSQPFMKVNRRGQRFANESTPYDFICFAATYQPGGVWCQVYDSNMMDDMLRFETVGCSRVVPYIEMGMTYDEYTAASQESGILMKADTIEELADGESIAVPNDTTNEARALLLLQDQGLLKLKDGAGLTATRRDIVDNPKNLKIEELEAAQLVRALPDVEIAVINGNYAILGGLKVKDALAAESADSVAAATYANILAVRAGDESRPELQALLQAIKGEKVKKFIMDTYEGAVVPAE